MNYYTLCLALKLGGTGDYLYFYCQMISQRLPILLTASEVNLIRSGKRQSAISFHFTFDYMTI